MKTLCTVSDSAYLIKGLALYHSLIRTSQDFTLFYLCLDAESYSALTRLSLKHLRPLYVGDIAELGYRQHRYFEGDMTSKVGDDQSYIEYCWSLASRLTLFLMRQMDTSVMYIDSDIVFYHDIDLLYQEIGESSIGIIPHLHVPVGHRVGGYNVAIVYFKNDFSGLSCLEFWHTCVTKDTPYKKEYGVCGDQKYLELFEKKFPGHVCVLQDQIMQGAPWNLRLFDYSTYSKGHRFVGYQGIELPLVFIHFSHFAPDFKNNSYSMSQGTYDESILKIPEIKLLYDEYLEFLDHARRKL